MEDLSFELAGGTLCALLGPNGGGKTTTVRMLLGLIAPTRGEARVAGIDVPGTAEGRARLRARAGLLTETPGFYDRLSAIENLVFFAELYGLAPGVARDRVGRWLKELGLWDRRDHLVATFSKGMKQRLAIARAVFHDPEVIFLDEPTSGLDPESAKDVRALILSLKQSGRTIVVCTHNLAEAEQLADVIAVLERRLLAFGRAGELGQTDGGERVGVKVTAGAEQARAIALAVPGVKRVEVDGLGLELIVEDSRRDIPALVRALAGAGVDVLAVLPGRSLEQVYLDVIGRAR